MSNDWHGKFKQKRKKENVVGGAAHSERLSFGKSVLKCRAV